MVQPLQISVASYPEGQVVSLNGAAGMEEATELRETLKKLAAQAGPRLVVDLQHLTFAGSMGLAALIEAHSECDKNHRELVLAQVPPAVMKVLKITELDRLFKMAATCQEALKKTLPPNTPPKH